ncbi:Pentatricopeptide repeat-containing protein At4g14170 [Linum grandiflorum]
MSVASRFRMRTITAPFLFSKNKFPFSTIHHRHHHHHHTEPAADASLVSSYFRLLHSSPHPTHLRHLHARLLRTFLYDNVILSSKLVFMYSRLGKLNPHSLSAFFHMPNRNIYSWNIVIGEFSRSNTPEISIELFLRMWREADARPDDFSLPLVLRACAGSGSAGFGVLLHGLCVKIGLVANVFVASALVFMYVTLGRMCNARKVFDEMSERDAVLWTSMLAGYSQKGEAVLGLRLLREMVDSEAELDGVVMVSVLTMCSQLGWLKQGKTVHAWCLRNCLGMELSLGNAIVDMYVKCFKLTYAQMIFDAMPVKDVFTWSSMILGYGLSGNVSYALWLFDKMLVRGVKPNDVTFLGVLSACAHGGLVEEGRLYFERMKEHGVVPELKHYANMVDCLGRAGRLEEAESLVEKMPVEADEAVLGAVLGSCRVHNNVEVGERIAKKLIRLEPEKGGYYVLLSNMYAASGRFEDAQLVREMMKDKNVVKVPGLAFEV